MQSLITAALTVLGGVVVYVAGRVIERAFIEPVNEQSAAITEALEVLEFYSNIWGNPDRWISDVNHSDIEKCHRNFGGSLRG